MNPGLRAGLLVTGGAVVISFAAIFVQLADVGASTSAFYRMLFGTAGFGALLLIDSRLRVGLRSGWASSLLIALCFTADLWFWHQSIAYIGPGLSTLLANFQVFVLTAVGVIWLKERISTNFALGLGLAMLGLWLLFGRDWAGLTAEGRLGVILGLLTALAYGSYLLTLRAAQIRTPDLRPETRLFQVGLYCTALFGLINLIEGQSFAIPSLDSLLALLALGLCCQVLGWLLITRGMPSLAAGVVGLLLLLQPSLSIIWDMLIFGLALQPVEFLGCALALVGIYLGFRAANRPLPAKPGP
jgi:drug/metabolite transporter (DMT)-like permease